MWADPNIVAKLQQAPGNLDAAFVRRYTMNDSAQLPAVWENLSASVAMRPWRLVIKQAIESYNDRRYAVVVPSLLLTFEGAVAVGSGTYKKRSTNPKRAASSKREETFAGIRRLTWTSIQAFTERVFEDAPFDQRRPQTINRHWVLHGRAVAQWAQRTECIRFFHALDTVLVTLDHPR
jgi:hypothetical protein